MTLQKSDDVYDLITITSPSQMLHFQTSAPPPPNTFTKALEPIGGSWECNTGFIFTLHIPAKHKDAFATEHVINLDDWEEVFSGLQELDELNDFDIQVNQAD